MHIAICEHWDLNLQNFVITLTFYQTLYLYINFLPNCRLLSMLAVQDFLYIILASILHIWKLFPYPQTNDTPCYSDKDPLLTALCTQ
jgi:uncharacterized membrane protein YqjE